MFPYVQRLSGKGFILGFSIRKPTFRCINNKACINNKGGICDDSLHPLLVPDLSERGGSHKPTWLMLPGWSVGIYMVSLVEMEKS